MKAIINGSTIECRAARKEDNRITLYLGRYNEFGDEETSVFVGFDPNDVVLEDGEWEDVKTEPTQLDQIEAQVVYTAMMTDTLLEV